MAVNIPPSLKSYTSYIRRAEELERNANRECQIVSYYCRFYAVSKISKSSEATQPDVQAFMFGQMDIMERVKPTLNLGAADRPFEICKSFAETVFQKADAEDGSGMADKGTAKIFYSAATFLEILEQFDESERDPSIGEMRKYAKWKATDILSAINEGRQPTAGGYTGGGSSEAAPSISDIKYSSDAHSSPPPPPIAVAPSSSPVFQNMIPAPPTTNPHLHLAPAAPFQQPYQPAPTSATAALVPAPVPRAATVYTSMPNINTDPRVKDSMELAQFAVAAMKQNNLALARERLAEAMARLG